MAKGETSWICENVSQRKQGVNMVRKPIKVPMLGSTKMQEKVPALYIYI